MYDAVKKWVATVLTISVIVFTLLAILAIWDVFDDDVAWKSLSTLGVLVFSCAITLVIIKIIEDKGQKPPTQLQ
mgnify:CR=1 FL=1